MPLSVRNANPKTVMPNFLARSFRASRAIWAIDNLYNDGSYQIGLNAQTSRATFEASLVCTSAQLTAMRDFRLARKGGAEEFYFYYGQETLPPFSYSSSIFGPSEGRYTVVFAGGTDWIQTVGTGRSEVQVTLIEVD
jgi:hypothetical protein